MVSARTPGTAGSWSAPVFLGPLGAFSEHLLQAGAWSAGAG